MKYLSGLQTQWHVRLSQWRVWTAFWQALQQYKEEYAKKHGKFIFIYFLGEVQSPVWSLKLVLLD